MKKYILIFVVVGFLVFIQSLFNGFVWDDIGGQVVNNYNLYGFDKIFKIFIYNGTLYYKPVFYLALNLLLSTFGNNPFPFHLVQLVIHIANTTLLFLLFSRFFKKNISFTLALIFLVHPAISEAVFYVSALQDVLYPFFGLIALNILVANKKFKYKTALIFLFLVISLLSKETGIAFLMLTIIYKFLFHRAELKKYMFLSAFFVLVYVFVRIGVLHYSILQESRWTYDVDFYTRLLTMPKIVFKYLTLFIWPKDLQIFQLWWVRRINFQDFFLPLTFILAFFGIILSLGAGAYAKLKEDSYPYIFFFCFILIGFLLHLQIIKLDMTFAERWLILPLIGFLGILGFILNKLLITENRTKTFYFISIIVVVLFSIRTFVRSFDWQDQKTIALHDFSVNRQNPGTYFILGGYYTDQKEYKKALKIYGELEKIIPNNENIDNNLWIIAKNQGDYKKAEETLGKSPKKLIGTKTNYAYTLIKNESKRADSYIKKLLEESPQVAQYYYLYALTKYALGDKINAVKYITRAVELSPGDSLLSTIKAKMERGEPINLDYSLL